MKYTDPKDQEETTDNKEVATPPQEGSTESTEKGAEEEKKD
jgi:hypothetical protein